MQTMTWDAAPQVDNNIVRLRRVASEVQGTQSAAVSEVCGNLLRLRSVLEEERLRFQGGMVQMRQKQTASVQQVERMSRAVIKVSDLRRQYGRGCRGGRLVGRDGGGGAPRTVHGCDDGDA